MRQSTRGPHNPLCRVLTLILTVGAALAVGFLWRAIHALFPDYRP
jgi:hypothetical protein